MTVIGLRKARAPIANEAQSASRDVVRQPLGVLKSQRASAKGQAPTILWFTGLSAAGKSTIANGVERRLAGLGFHTYTLDGDNLRLGLNRDLGFSEADRAENIRRVGEVAKLFADAGLIVLCSFISPFRADRRFVRDLVEPGEFIEIFVDAPIDLCARRDPKGLYRRALAGEIRNFTGLDSPYEAPDEAELRLDTAAHDVDTLVEEVVAYLRRAARIG